MKHGLSKIAGSKMFSKLQKLGAKGSMTMARKGMNAPRKYAIGGSVNDGNDGDGDEVGGEMGRPRADRVGKRAKSSDKKPTVVVNITPTQNQPMPVPVPAPQAAPPPPPPPMPPPGGPPGGPMGGPGGPPGGGPMGPGGPMGGPPNPMAGLIPRKNGGRVRRAEGGPAWQGEGDTGRYMREKANSTRGSIPGAATGVLGGALIGTAPRVGRLLRRVGQGAAIGSGAAGAEIVHRANELDREAERAEGRAKGGHTKRKGC